ncbi:hypothetical protein COJ27_26050 [Bacillus cereus]|uniref:hypothetical protein n=1 Tax=Bacillus cereus TaxID=1396 RepID=UPI000BF75BBC|nr:hypothetical protein [Bacillus cereus]PFL58912.1 hypothetical protein COJ27_26050 [Bacillus cereus]
MSKEEFWKTKIHSERAKNNPFRLKPFEISNPIVIQGTDDPPGYERRIKDVKWILRYKETPGDTDHINVYIANKKIIDGKWEIKLYNSSPEEVTVDVFGIQEEKIGYIEVEPI